ncbi:jg11519 [Pararge aegeria aegeria]|uniref:Jg11519 protein n=1 Tax=Pararge aegeria aegeria TaxID=348720 RepID=A0A8S4RMQ2_9NEOP|nr:jg11519 [Pararge aegeria aegeria]
MDGAPEVLSDTATNCNFTSASETISDNNYQAKQDSLEKKAVHLRLMLEKDFKAADLKWSLFVAAAFSFGYESCLKPFPPVFMKNGIKDMDELLSVITDVPALDLVLQQLDNLENLSNISDILDLLFYVLVRLKEPSLKTIPQEATNIKGNGVNLSPELCLSIPYSHGGFGWGASCIGGHLSCIAMCEVIDAHEGINYHVKPVTNEGDGVYEQEKMLNAETGARTSHFVVTNCDLIRVRYLLVYAKQPTSMRFPTTTSNREVICLQYGLKMQENISWCLMSLFYYSVVGQDPVANLQQGRVVGIQVFTENSLKPIEGFFGIPYASPPTGRLRFSRVDGKLLPVVIILYSDSWTKNGITLPCQELAAEGVVVVTVAYRLHILSFFTLKSIKARGNLALLDQYMALLWIRENIVAFGGDPNAITLLGHSAGADSILYHIISPRTVGLFQRAIIMSPNNIWKAVENDGETNFSIEKMSQTVIKSLSCVRGSENEILQCLRTRSASDLFNSISNNWTINNEIFQPITDNFLPEKEQYLPLSLSAALVSSKSPNIQLDVLLGTADLDAINYDFNYEDVARRGQDSLYELASLTIIPEILSLLSIDRPDTLPLLSQAIRWEFLGPKTRSQSGVDGIMKLTETIARMETSAKWGAGCALLAAKLARRVSHLYTYRYSIPTDINLYGRTINFTGATHGAEIMTLLGNALMLQIARRTATQSEKKLSMQFRNYIINFVKFGSPDNQNEWPRYIVGDSYIHEICKKEASNCNKYKTSKEIAFWLQYLPRLSSILTSNEQAENVITSNEQYGFTKGRSTRESGAKLKNHVYDAWESSHNAIGVFCDLSKAFDCIEHKLSHYARA